VPTELLGENFTPTMRSWCVSRAVQLSPFRMRRTGARISLGPGLVPVQSGIDWTEKFLTQVNPDHNWKIYPYLPPIE
jgi:hypothetical protein